MDEVFVTEFTFNGEQARVTVLTDYVYGNYTDKDGVQVDLCFYRRHERFGRLCDESTDIKSQEYISKTMIDYHFQYKAKHM